MGLLQETLQNIMPIDREILAAVQRTFARQTGEAGSWGDLAGLTARYAAASGVAAPDIPRKAIVLMAGDHGVALRGVSAFPQEVTVQMVANYLAGRAGANVLAQHAGAKLFIVDIGVNGTLPRHSGIIDRKIARGTADFTCGPAMSRGDAIKALEIGIEIAGKCVDQGYGLLGLAEMGIGNTTASAAIAVSLCNLPADRAVGRGSGISDSRLQLKMQAVSQALAFNQPDAQDGLDVVSKIGGFDIAGLAGVILGGAARRTPIMLDGLISTAAALIAWRLNPLSVEYMLGSHLSAEPAHREMLALLGLRAPLRLAMRLGEGTGAALGMTLLDAGIDIMRWSRCREAGASTIESNDA